MNSARIEHTVSSEVVSIWALIDARTLTRHSLERLLKSAGRKFHVLAVEKSADLFDAEDVAQSQLKLAIYRVTTPSIADPETRATIASLIERLRETPLVLLCERDDPREVRQALAYGVRGYITTSLDPELVMEALRLVGAGGTFVPPHTLQSVVDGAGAVAPMVDGDDENNDDDENDDNNNPAVDRLTAREVAVMREMAKGLPNKVIARELGIQESTVKVHVRQVMKKLHAANRTQVALLARRWCEASVPEHNH